MEFEQRLEREKEEFKNKALLDKDAIEKNAELA